MIEIIRSVKQSGTPGQESVECALSTGCSDVAAIRHLVGTSELARSRPGAIELKTELARFERPLPAMNEYDQLLNAGVAQ